MGERGADVDGSTSEKERVRSGYRGRFAPSPTGLMHLGLARTALLGWLRARSQGGTFIVRVEDIDAPRTLPGAAEQLLADLRYLGLDWDEGPDVGGAHGPYVQSQRLALYRQALTRLRASGHVYPCSCSRKEIAIASAPHGPAEFGAIYAGSCRHGPLRPGAPCALRLRVPDELPWFDDLLLGRQAPLARGDFVLQRADGLVSYQLAVVVDDIEMQVSEVLRGADLAGCTGWQLALYGALAAEPPAFVHVPLLVGPDGKRLAKRAGAQPIAALRAAGVAAETIVGALASSAGLLPPGTRSTARELVARFELTRIAETPIDFEQALKSAR